MPAPTWAQVRGQLDLPVVDCRDYGIHGDGVAIASGAMASMIETVLATKVDAAGVAIYFPAGQYLLPNEPITITRSDFTFHKLRLFGAGKGLSLFRQPVDTQQVFHFVNTGSNYHAELQFRGLGFYGGHSCIRADNMTYSEISDCMFRWTGRDTVASYGDSGYAIHLEGTTSKVRIWDVWAYHSGDVLRVVSGEVGMSNCYFGEDCGSIYVSGVLRANDCTWDADTFDKGTPAGYLSMGKAAVTVAGGARAHFDGCSIATATGGQAFLNADLANAVTLDGCTYSLGGGPLVRTRRIFDRGVSIRGGQARVTAPTALWEVSGVNDLESCAIEGLRIAVDTNDSLTVPDAFFDPQHRNVYRDNFVWEN